MVLVLIGLQSIEPPVIHDAGSMLPVILLSTNVLLLDVLLRVLFVVFGIAIMLGIRTRLLSAFMLAVTILTASVCIQTFVHMDVAHLFLAYLVVGLATLVVRGGGIYALLSKGWRNIPL